jgi:glycosyltransferase involved in cell wall biosynthesis
VYAAYPSSVPAMIARVLSNKPVIIDAFYSNFDSVVNDRQKFKRWSRQALKLLTFDWLGVMFAHVIITDTKEHVRYWGSWWGMVHKKMHAVYIGFDDALFSPVPFVKKDFALVNFHGTFIPLQGTTKIVEAARLCSDDPNIRFRLIGDGRDFSKAKNLIEKYGLKNVELTGMKPQESINGYVAESDITLGIFGDTAKAQRVIPNKVYECLAVGRPVITMDTPAIREIFSDQDLLIVDGTPHSLAEGIRKLAADETLRVAFAKKGRTAVLRYDPRHIGKMLADILVQYTQK